MVLSQPSYTGLVGREASPAGSVDEDGGRVLSSPCQSHPRSIPSRHQSRSARGAQHCRGHMAAQLRSILERN